MIIQVRRDVLARVLQAFKFLFLKLTELYKKVCLISAKSVLGIAFNWKKWLQLAGFNCIWAFWNAISCGFLGRQADYCMVCSVNFTLVGVTIKQKFLIVVEVTVF